MSGASQGGTRNTRSGQAFVALLDVMDQLRDPGGCPWDREQTLATLRKYLIEEAYEVLDAIDADNVDDHREELGDLLLQIVFQSKLRSETGAFDAGDVADSIRTKLVRRHPHVFADAQVQGADNVAQRWADIKATEKARESVLDGIPRALPALQRAQKMGERASNVGFDWTSASEVVAKLDEERAELDAALRGGDPADIEAELGDYLFTVVNAARHLGVDAESALRGAADRFERRLRRVEGDARGDCVALSALSPAELDERWRRAKSALDQG
jgi:MazG family protein